MPLSAPMANSAGPSQPRIRIILSLVFCFLFASIALRADDINKISPTGYVTDLAGVIPAATKQRVETLCTELEQKTGAQLAVVTVKSPPAPPAQDYTAHLFTQLTIR